MAQQAETLSAAHPFRPQCVVDSVLARLTTRLSLVEHAATNETVNGASSSHQMTVTRDANEAAEMVIAALDAGECPRCGGPLPDEPVGSRATSCRCVPVCLMCGGRESYLTPEPQDQHLDGWPMDDADIEQEDSVLIQVFTDALHAVQEGDGYGLMEVGLTWQAHPGRWPTASYQAH